MRIREGESIEGAIRRFRKMLERSGMRREIRRQEYYEKPSDARRREKTRRIRNMKKAMGQRGR